MSSERIANAIRFLEEHGIAYERHDHAAVFTVDQVTALVDIRRGQRTKNLFVRDKKGRRHVLVVVPHDKQVDLMALGQRLDAGRLSFASERRLMEHLGVEPGSVTLMGVMNDKDRAVEVVIDRQVWDADAVRCHPLVNTSTLVLESEGVRQLLAATGHEPNVMEVPDVC
ncbi:MAG: prolyl-tRNA synthetase associated domain-containing protein [Bacteroidetes bacterium]|nr:prolyl-tRNA synthetase associated domain-containing protein [Bacteroidota bacterium]MDA0874382.1 prolyl-tRNA synthetase associated domain-containing protein [Bacteroidota bacterium]